MHSKEKIISTLKEAVEARQSACLNNDKLTIGQVFLVSKFEKQEEQTKEDKALASKEQQPKND